MPVQMSITSSSFLNEFGFNTLPGAEDIDLYLVFGDFHDIRDFLVGEPFEVAELHGDTLLLGQLFHSLTDGADAFLMFYGALDGRGAEKVHSIDIFALVDLHALTVESEVTSHTESVCFEIVDSIELLAHFP